MKYAICGYLCIALTTTAWGQRANDGRLLSTSEERALRTGNTFKECEKCPSMVVVSSGSFEMGSPANEAGRRSVEGPRYTVIRFGAHAGRPHDDWVAPSGSKRLPESAGAK
jgi:hypothetical protein